MIPPIRFGVTLIIPVDRDPEGVPDLSEKLTQLYGGNLPPPSLPERGTENTQGEFGFHGLRRQEAAQGKSVPVGEDSFRATPAAPRTAQGRALSLNEKPLSAFCYSVAKFPDFVDVLRAQIRPLYFLLLQVPEAMGTILAKRFDELEIGYIPVAQNIVQGPNALPPKGVLKMVREALAANPDIQDIRHLDCNALDEIV